MRITSSMYYNNVYGSNNDKLSKELFDVNKQIASGLKIQYASDDVGIFTETMRLDNEVTVLGQIKQSAESGYKVSNQSDVTLNEFDTSINRMRTLLIQAANGTNDETSLDSIAKELRGIEKNFIGLANTSINGQYLFAGSAVDVKPISEDGTYNGNGVSMNAFLGSQNQQQYNISGAELFLGEESSIKREVSSNVANVNLLDPISSLTPASTIAELMGDKDPTKLNQSHFYVRGTRSDGTTFKNVIDLNKDATVQDLLTGIENSYADNTVNVTINDAGEIVVADKQKGSSKLDFHLVGAVDYNVDYTSGSAVPADTRAIVSNIDLLNAAETDYDLATATSLFVKEFSKSGLASSSGVLPANNIEGTLYDRVEFQRDGATLESNVSQILRKTHYVKEGVNILDTIPSENENDFAQPSTLLSEVADTKTEILPSTNPKTYTIDGTKFELAGFQVDGSTQYDVTINLDATGATFTDNATLTTYNMYNVDGSIVEPDKMTYQQLMGVINMAVTGTMPTLTADSDAYHAAVENSGFKGETSLTYDGKISFEDLTNATTQATLSLYDANSADFTQDASIMTFNANNALTTRDPKTDFFKNIDEIISAVEKYKNYPNAGSAGDRNIGMQNAIGMLDDLRDHLSRSHAIVGASSNTLNTAIERTETLEISTMSLRSSIVDTDLAESSLRLTQLTLNYQAMLSTVGKVSQLSLVNYL